MRGSGIQVQSPQWKAALIAMALFLAACRPRNAGRLEDYCYFVKGGESARRESALGRPVLL